MAVSVDELWAIVERTWERDAQINAQIKGYLARRESPPVALIDEALISVQLCLSAQRTLQERLQEERTGWAR